MTTPSDRPMHLLDRIRRLEVERDIALILLFDARNMPVDQQAILREEIEKKARKRVVLERS